MFIDSVENGEIRVTVGGEECEARVSGDNDPNSVSSELFCKILTLSFPLCFSFIIPVHMFCTKGSPKWDEHCTSCGKCTLLMWLLDQGGGQHLLVVP